MNNDELDELFVDKNEPVDKVLLVEILKSFVTIDVEGEVSFSEEYEKLGEQKKALIYLLCRKAMIIREVEDMLEPMGPLEVSKKAHISESSAKKSLCVTYKKLLKKVEGGYIIPNYGLRKVKEIILKDG